MSRYIHKVMGDIQMEGSVIRGKSKGRMVGAHALYLINCDITSFETFPDNVGLVEIENCHVKSLLGFPKNVTGDIILAINDINHLEGLPDIVNGDLNVSSNDLTTLHGCPSHIKGDFDCSGNLLWGMDGFPTKVGGDVWFQKMGKFIDEEASNYFYENVEEGEYIDWAMEDYVREHCQVGGKVYV